MKNNKKHIILLYLIILVLAGVNIISNRNIIFNNKIILKNMDESTQIADKEKTIDDLNTSQTEYSNYITTSKTNLAKAITNAGVSTSGTDSLETMITNVSKILSTKTSDATATADTILSGKTAYVKGRKVTGTIENKGAVTASINAGETYTIPKGYHNGSGKVTSSVSTTFTQTDNTIIPSDIEKCLVIIYSRTTYNGYFPGEQSVVTSKGSVSYVLQNYTDKGGSGQYDWKSRVSVATITDCAGATLTIKTGSYPNVEGGFSIVY